MQTVEPRKPLNAKRVRLETAGWGGGQGGGPGSNRRAVCCPENPSLNNQTKIAGMGCTMCKSPKSRAEGLKREKSILYLYKYVVLIAAVTCTLIVCLQIFPTSNVNKTHSHNATLLTRRRWGQRLRTKHMKNVNDNVLKS